MAARLSLSDSVQYVKGVGPRRAEKLARLGIHTVRDLLYHVPHRYEDATTVTPISSLETGDDATVIGRVVSTGVLPTRRRLRIFRAVIRDRSGLIECAWPGQPWLDRQISRGDLLLVSGPVRFFHGRQIQPREFTVLEAAGEERPGEQGRVFPVYPVTEGLSQRQLRAILDRNLDDLLALVEDAEPFGEAWLSSLGLPPLRAALATLHRPERVADVDAARRRLAYEELFFLQLLHARARHELRSRERGCSFAGPERLSGPFLRGLPFRLTPAQRRAWEEIRADMAAPIRMYRLLQGDVGSGKTVVAAAALLRALEHDRQAVLMAPTELLAEQHVRTLEELLTPVGVRPRLYTGAVTGAARSELREALRAGDPLLLVGTHALIQEGVEYGAPGLMVVDEQHRFGVEQRRLLRDAGDVADTLVMSATPIPRSLALTLYGDLDLSVIDEMPPGRQPVTTAVRGPEAREAAFEFVRERLERGSQAYVVYPLIEESEAVDARAATAMRDELAARFGGHEVGLLHGRLGSVEKEEVMRRFRDGGIRVLVATTVIEVGIDVPGANVMVIENAERFGLAQLHQLRGRVGRGGRRAYCIAFHSTEEPGDRLRAFAATRDGFALARADLRIRGQGDLFGAEQHGLPDLRFADLERDAELLEHARRRAREIVEEDPGLGRPPHRRFARLLAERYADREALYGIG